MAITKIDIAAKLQVVKSNIKSKLSEAIKGAGSSGSGGVPAGGSGGKAPKVPPGLMGKIGLIAKRVLPLAALANLKFIQDLMLHILPVLIRNMMYQDIEHCFHLCNWSQ